MRANGRRYRRYRICLPVEMFIGKDKLFVQTADIGMDGVFVRTETRPKGGDLVRLVVALPFGAGALTLLGRVAQVRGANSTKRHAGVGVALFGNGPTERDAWQSFVREVERRYPEAAEHAMVVAGDGLARLEPPGAPSSPVVPRAAESSSPVRPPALPRRKGAAHGEPPKVLASVEPAVDADASKSVGADRRRFQRFEIMVEVKAYFASVEDLVLLHTRDLSEGGMFIATSIATADGERLTLRVVHPDSKAEFPIPCVVRRCVSDAAQRGLAVEFQLDEEGRDRFWTFISGAVAARMESKGRSVNYF